MFCVRTPTFVPDLRVFHVKTASRKAANVRATGREPLYKERAARHRQRKGP